MTADQSLALALNLAANTGWCVFPCLDNKAPACPHGFQDASRDQAAIAHLWRRFPGPLIGIATGAVSGIDALDVDAQHPTALAWLAAARTRIGPTRQYATRSGGSHLYFKHGAGLRNSQSKIAKGIDVRADGGYVIAWFAAGLACESDAPPAAWPPWLLECALWIPPAEPISPVLTQHPDRAISGIVRFVAEAPEGERNGRLHWAACRMRERVSAGDVSNGDARAQLLAAASIAGLAKAEATRTIGSAWRSA